MMDNFTAIDFETAQGKRWSICQIGLVRVENSKFTEELSILVQPPQNFYWSNFTDIHGISKEHTSNAPRFDQIWPHIEPLIKNQNVVAHNGFAFDFSCLQQTLEYYQLENPNFIGHCTYKLYRDNLASLCRQYNIKLNHHDALSDARACAELFLKFLKERKQYGK